MKSQKIAIACQGGGTHAAFTWGILKQILETKARWDAQGSADKTFDILGISGTSAGALCALAAWYGLAPNTADPRCGTLDKAIERLNFLWTTFSAQKMVETEHNAFLVSQMIAREKGIPLPSYNPYGVIDDIALNGLAAAGARPEYLEFPALLHACCPHFEQIDWPRVERRLLVGAIEVISGNHEAFDSDKTLENLGYRSPRPEKTNPWRVRRPISLEGVAASGTLPQLLVAQRIPALEFPGCEEGESIVRDGVYWDGLYSQNPPVREFLDPPTIEEKPDEIWVIRINPQERENEPTETEAIRDRENELSGNVSLNQELDTILMINRWLGQIQDAAFLEQHKQVTVRTIKMTQDTAWGLTASSKFNRHPRQLMRLHDEGVAVAEQWLKDWRKPGAALEYPRDARYPAAG